MKKRDNLPLSLDNLLLITKLTEWRLCFFICMNIKISDFNADKLKILSKESL